MSPHQRAVRAVLTLWTGLSLPIAIVAALTVAALVARVTPGHADGGLFMLIYSSIAFPGAVGGVWGQARARRWLARRTLRQLDAGARDAVGGADPVGFLGTGAGDDVKR